MLSSRYSVQTGCIIKGYITTRAGRQCMIQAKFNARHSAGPAIPWKNPFYLSIPFLVSILFLAEPLCPTGVMLAQILDEDTLERNHEPVVLTGSQLDLLSQFTILNDRIFCYAYTDTGWTQVILQIDERDRLLLSFPNTAHQSMWLL